MAGKPLRYDDPTGMGPVALSVEEEKVEALRQRLGELGVKLQV